MPVGPRERPEGLWRGCHWGDMAGVPADGIGVKGYKNKDVTSTLYVYPRGGAVSGHPDCRKYSFEYYRHFTLPGPGHGVHRQTL